MREHIATEDVAMGNVQTVWSAVADEVNRMIENQKVAVGESSSAIEELCPQMTLVHADLEVADQRMNCHRSNLDRDVVWLKRIENHLSFMASQVTTLESDWGNGKFSKHSALLECMDKQDAVIQDLREQVAILQGNQCRCFDVGLGLLADADGELDYEDDKGVEVQPPWSSILPMFNQGCHFRLINPIGPHQGPSVGSWFHF